MAEVLRQISEPLYYHQLSAGMAWMCQQDAAGPSALCWHPNGWWGAIHASLCWHLSWYLHNLTGTIWINTSWESGLAVEPPMKWVERTSLLQTPMQRQPSILSHVFHLHVCNPAATAELRASRNQFPERNMLELPLWAHRRFSQVKHLSFDLLH